MIIATDIPLNHAIKVLMRDNEGKEVTSHINQYTMKVWFRHVEERNMPQVAAHYVIADRLSTKLGARNPGFVAGNPEAYKLGAIGPDMSFFLLDSAPARDVLFSAMRVYFVIADIKDLAEDITNKIGGPAADFADWVTGGLSTDFGALMDRAATAAKLALEVSLLPGSTVSIANPFQGAGIPGIGNSPSIIITASDISIALRAFGHPYSSDPPFRPAPEPPGSYAGWWWMDILHYRRTGLMIDALRNQANDDFERAYVQGWTTHVAGDVSGHPYINGVVGGPYRNHVIRHLVIEKLIDTWVHQRFNGTDIISAALQKQCDVGANFPRIAALLNRALDRVYVNPVNRAAGLPPIRPGFLASSSPTIADWQAAFDLMQRYLGLATDTGIAPPVPPPGSPAQFFAEVGASIAGTAGNVGGAFSSSNTWWEWLLAPFLAALYALVLVFKLLTLPAAVLTRVLTLAPRWFAYYLQVGLHTAVRELRWQLSLSGFGFASAEDLTRTFAQASLHVAPMRSGPNAFSYPHMQVPRAQGFWLHDPALFPSPSGAGVTSIPIETIPGFRGVQCSPYLSSMLPDSFIEGRPFDPVPARQKFLAQMAAEGISVGTTVENERETFLKAQPLSSGTQFGSAVEFAEQLLDPTETMLGSWDLDGDQGYGFLSWEGPPPSYTSINPADLLTKR